MVLSYCDGCMDHRIIESTGESYSKCNKEDCLSVYTRCISGEAVKEFILNSAYGDTEWVSSALEICYQYQLE